ncbi:DnaD domain-containing protein [Jeotgalibaca dankookensis]|uniref:DnaD domain-containing protein n=1 Tax=Jeotgalibaca dankookensis TaxID=708126 RepID=UPI0007802ED0|nr:DnaD domain protein [Jeotgalibaca dankookensis]
MRDPHGTELEGELEEEGEEEIDKELQLEKNQTAATASQINKVNNFFQDNFSNLNQHIKQDLKHWIEEIGSDLVLEAMKRAVEAEKNYNYAKGIMKSWKMNSVKTLKDVEEEDDAFTNRKRPTYSKKEYVQKETLPEWARDDYQPPKEVVDTKNEEISDRLSRLREYKKERGIIQ